MYLSSARSGVIKRFSVWGSNEIWKSETRLIVSRIVRCIIGNLLKYSEWRGLSFKLIAAKFVSNLYPVKHQEKESQTILAFPTNSVYCSGVYCSGV